RGQTGLRIGGAIGKVERLTRRAAARRTHGTIGGNRQTAAAKRLRRAGCIRVLVGIKGIAAASSASARGRRLLHHRRLSCDLPLRIALLLRIGLLSLQVTATLRLGVAPLWLGIAPLARRLAMGWACL